MLAQKKMPDGEMEELSQVGITMSNRLEKLLSVAPEIYATCFLKSYSFLTIYAD